MFTLGFEKTAISLQTAQSLFAKRVAKAWEDPEAIDEFMDRLPKLDKKKMKALSGHSWRNLIPGEKSRRGLLNSLKYYKERGLGKHVDSDVWSKKNKRYLSTTPHVSPAELAHPELVSFAAATKHKAGLKATREALDSDYRKHSNRDSEWLKYRR